MIFFTVMKERGPCSGKIEMAQKIMGSLHSPWAEQKGQGTIMIRKKIFRMLSLVMAITMLAGLNVFAAQSRPGSWFDLPAYEFHVKQGDILETDVWAQGDFIIIIPDATNTGCTYVGKRGRQDVTFYIGDNEQKDTVKVLFYPVDHHDRYDYMLLRIDKRKEVPATQADMTFADGTAGKVSTVNNSKNGFVTDSEGNAMAAFAVYGKKRYEEIQVAGNTVVNGMSLIVAATPNDRTAGKVSIPAEDKALMLSKGIQGLYLNNRVVLWP